MNHGTYIGIDFGTTNTAVVEIVQDLQGMKVIPLGEGGQYPFSSIVATPKTGDGALLFGQAVRKERQSLAETHYIYPSMKSYLGTNREFIVGTQRYSATDITTQFLKYVKEYILLHHKIEISMATFSFPVDFSPEARRELGCAAVRAGIQPLGFVSESTAAFLANRDKGQAYSNVMVVDWGGGTLDISLLNITKDALTEVSVWGDKIGGDDIDRAFAQGVHSKIIRTASEQIPFDSMSPKEQDSMLDYCEKAKMEFSTDDDEQDLTVRNYGVYGTKTETIQYDFFEGITLTIVKNRVLAAIDTALQRAQMTKESLGAVIIVGGSSNIRPFETAICETFGKEKIIFPDNKQWSVAKGAAVAGSLKGTFKLNSTVSVLLSDDTTFPIFEKGIHTIGSEFTWTFDLTEDTEEAHFIIVNENKQTLARRFVKVKGYLKEKITLHGEITGDQIAHISIKSTAIGEDDAKIESITLNKLTFYYDLSELEKD